MLSRNSAYPQVSILPLPLRTEVPGSAEPCLAAFPPAPGIPMKPPNFGRPSGLRRVATSFPLAGPVRRRASFRMMLSRNTACPQVRTQPLPLRTEVPGSAEPCLAAVHPAPGVPIRLTSGDLPGSEEPGVLSPRGSRSASGLVPECSAGTLRILRSAYYPCLFEPKFPARQSRAWPPSLQHQASR